MAVLMSYLPAVAAVELVVGIQLHHVLGRQLARGVRGNGDTPAAPALERLAALLLRVGLPRGGDGALFDDDLRLRSRLGDALAHLADDLAIQVVGQVDGDVVPQLRGGDDLRAAA